MLVIMRLLKINNMRKFKCVKNYPGADLGTIVQYQLGAFPEYFDIKDAKRYNKKDIENYPEFWEEIVEKDYEILSGRTHIPSGSTEIYSIRRKSDGIEFKIGDKLDFSDDDDDKCYKSITEISLNSIGKDGMGKRTVPWLQCGKDYGTCLEYARLVKEPILTTEDGYEMFEGDCVYFITPLMNTVFVKQNITKDFSDTCIYFKTKENVEKYIYENKPEFSRKQILDAIDICDSYYTTHSDNYFIKVSHLKRLLNL